jgi:MoxR-like ATPase
MPPSPTGFVTNGPPTLEILELTEPLRIQPQQSSELVRLETALNEAIRGKPEVVRLALVAALADGHMLIEDVPGVGKTTLARALARGIGGQFNRIQFTSDMLPADILGVSIYEPDAHNFKFHPGPIFAHLLLADEINRTTPRTQSALLEAMSEGRCTVEQVTRPLPRPFLVMATQNPKEHHGTYPLPESQMDRFMLRIRIGYPEADLEKSILKDFGHEDAAEQVPAIMSTDRLLFHQQAVARVVVREEVLDDLMAIVTATRQHPEIHLGVSPRGAISVYRAAQARAYVDGRDFATPDDVRSLVLPCFVHRVVTRGSVEDGGRGEAEALLREIMEGIPAP